jgi:hypothetical protein
VILFFPSIKKFKVGHQLLLSLLHGFHDAKVSNRLPKEGMVIFVANSLCDPP